ncbi:MAG: S9 family peptidase [Burkholderiaceae bacterium]
MDSSGIDRRRFLQSAACLSASGLWCGASRAQGGTPSVEDFFRWPQHADLSLSPNGTLLAAIVPIHGRRNIAIIDLKDMRGRVLTALKESDIGFVAWVNDRRIVYGLTDLQRALGEITPGGLYAVNVDASEPRELSPPVGLRETEAFVRFRRARFAGVFRPAQGDDILVLANDRNLDYPDVYRMDTRTGRKTLLTPQTPGRTVQWLTDRTGVARVAVTDEDDLKFALHYRAGDAAPWRKLAQFHPFNEPERSITPLAFDYDGTLLVAALAGDKTALYRYDVKENRLGERLVAHKDYDLGAESFDALGRGAGPIFDHVKRRLVGIQIEAERPQFVWFDQEWANWHAMANKALPDAVNVLSRTSDNTKLLLRSYSDRDPGTWYFLDPAKRRLEQLVSAMPWIKPADMAPRQPLRLKARDGLSLPAYLTLPRGREPKGLPLIVLVHGGPYVRGETWRFDPEAQFLASRGYAVLQVDFRGSLGYGWKHYQAGWKQWGLAMQDDLNDTALELVERGVADRARLAIMGASYGGYATMMGLARDPELWRCGVNYVGVTDLTLLTTATWSDTNQIFKNASSWFDIHVGDASRDRERFEKTSPLRLADRIKRPVLMVYGGLDQRVPIEHGARMKSALDRNNVPNEFVVYDTEGHGFRLEKNRFDFYRRVEAFLAKHMA